MVIGRGDAGIKTVKLTFSKGYFFVTKRARILFWKFFLRGTQARMAFQNLFFLASV
jgi:hypothetical protein